MTRTIYLAIFSNDLRPAHWAIFVPNVEEGTAGKLIHVIGSPASGFFLEFKREYDFKETFRKYRIIPLAQVNERFIAAPATNAQAGRDTIARDRLKSSATIVQPPPSSANPFDPSNERCQSWIQRYVQQFIDDGFVDGSALSVIQDAPKVI